MTTSTVQALNSGHTARRFVQMTTRGLQILIERIRLARRRSKLLHELQRLDDHSLRDIGLRRSELPSVVAEVTGAAPATRRQVMASHR